MTAAEQKKKEEDAEARGDVFFLFAIMFGFLVVITAVMVRILPRMLYAVYLRFASSFLPLGLWAPASTLQLRNSKRAISGPQRESNMESYRLLVHALMTI